MQYEECFSHPMGLWRVESGSVFPGVYVSKFLYANTSIWPYSVHRIVQENTCVRCEIVEGNTFQNGIERNVCTSFIHSFHLTWSLKNELPESVGDLAVSGLYRVFILWNWFHNIEKCIYNSVFIIFLEEFEELIITLEIKETLELTLNGW